MQQLDIFSLPVIPQDESSKPLPGAETTKPDKPNRLREYLEEQERYYLMIINKLVLSGIVASQNGTNSDERRRMRSHHISHVDRLRREVLKRLEQLP